MLTGVDVGEPVYDAVTRRVTGVRLVRHDAQAEPGFETVTADLVIDCSGRGSRSLTWLDGWGYEPPPEERVRVDLSYTSAYFARENVLPK